MSASTIRRLEASPDEALRAVARAAEAWGADFEAQGAGGRLELPVNAGLRHGRLAGTVRAVALGEAATELGFTVEREEFKLPRVLVGLLLCGALGAVTALGWPFVPGLGKLAPMGALIALAVWFLVLAKARYVGVEVFFDRVEDEIAAQESPNRE
ncbi:MAG: hypothetical protein SF066_07985 [Thermoanaerobaculia bacterium]|nr:hypothetical protein [Thermoanaerobaculia bacterium]